MQICKYIFICVCICGFLQVIGQRAWWQIKCSRARPPGNTKFPPAVQNCNETLYLQFNVYFKENLSKMCGSVAP